MIELSLSLSLSLSHTYTHTHQIFHISLKPFASLLLSLFMTSLPIEREREKKDDIAQKKRHKEFQKRGPKKRNEGRGGEKGKNQLLLSVFHLLTVDTTSFIYALSFSFLFFAVHFKFSPFALASVFASI